MACCGDTYIVNEDDGSYSKRKKDRKKDTSFRSIITFLVSCLILLLVILCIFLSQRNEKNEKQNLTIKNNSGTFTTQSLRNYKNTTSVDELQPSSKYISDNSNKTNSSIEETKSTKISNEINDLNKNYYESTTTRNLHNDSITTDSATTTELFDDFGVVIDNKVLRDSIKNFTREKYTNNNMTLSTYLDGNDTIEYDSFSEIDNTDEDSDSKENDSNQIFKNKKEVTNSVDSTESTSNNYGWEGIEGFWETDDSNSSDLNKDSDLSLKNYVSDSNHTFTTIGYSTNDHASTNKELDHFVTETSDFQSSEYIKSYSPEPHYNESYVTLLENNIILIKSTKNNSYVLNDIQAEKPGLEELSNKDYTKKINKLNQIGVHKEETPLKCLDSFLPEEECLSSSCKLKAKEMLQLMDHSVEPCEDFYQFSCGGLKNLEEQRYNGQFDLLMKFLYNNNDYHDKYYKIFIKFFESCARHEEELGYSDKINNVLNTYIRGTNLTELLAFLLLRQSTPLFEVRYGPVSGKENYSLQILPPDSSYETIGLKDWTLESRIKKHCLGEKPYLRFQPSLNLVNIYHDYKECQKDTLQKLAKHFVDELSIRTFGVKDGLLDDFKNIFTMIFMNKASSEEIQNAILQQRYTVTNIEKLNEKYPFIDWGELLETVTDGSITRQKPIYLYLEKEYFERLFDQLKERTLRHSKEIIAAMALYYQLELYENTVTPNKNIEDFCLKRSVELMPEIAIKISNMIFTESGNKKYDFGILFKQIKHDFLNVVRNSRLAAEGKKAFNKEFEKVTFDDFMNLNFMNSLEKIYGDVRLKNDYLSNIFLIIEKRRKFANSLSNAIAENNLFLYTYLEDPFQNVPITLPYSELIVIPTGLYHEINAMYKMGYPRYLIDFSLKLYLSRAMALQFDDIVKEHDYRFYSEFVDSFNLQLEEDDKEKIINGQKILYQLHPEKWKHILKLSVKTRLADSLALQVIYKEKSIGFKSLPWISKSYCPEQMFFILVAQEFCEKVSTSKFTQALFESSKIPSIFRVDSLMINSNGFAKSFDCKKGTKMNLEFDKIQFDTFQGGEENYLFEN